MHNNAADARYELAQVSTFLLQTLAEVVEGHGVDPARLCRGLGFTVEDLQDPTQRISYRQAVSMIQRALQALPERGLGLWVGHQNVLGTLGLLGHVLSLCRTLRDAFDIGVRYQHSSGGIVTSSVYQQGDTFFVEVECHLPSSEVQVFAIEEFFASLLVYGRALVSPAFEPLGIELIHAAPPYAGEYLRLLGPQVRFGCLHNRMAIASHWLDMRLPNHNLPALRQALVDQFDGALGGAAGRQRDGPPGQLLQARVAPVALARHQHQRHIGAHRRARADLQAVVRRQQFAGGDQVAFATLQGGKQLVLGLGYELEGEVPRGRRTAVEVLLEGAQATVLDADRLALHLARAVAALVDQHLEHASAADARQVAGLRLFPVPVVRLAGDARSRRQGCEHQQAKRKQQQTRHPGLQRPGSMSLSGGPDQSEHGSLGKFLSDSGCKRRHWVDNPGAEEPDLRL